MQCRLGFAGAQAQQRSTFDVRRYIGCKWQKIIFRACCDNAMLCPIYMSVVIVIPGWHGINYFISRINNGFKTV